MKKKTIQTFFAIVISLSIPLLQASTQYSDLADADFLAGQLSFESPDANTLLNFKNHEPRLGVTAPSLNFVCENVFFVHLLLQSHSLLTPLEQTTPLLRC